MAPGKKSPTGSINELPPNIVYTGSKSSGGIDPPSMPEPNVELKPKKVQFQIDQVTGIMDQNVQKLLERGERLEDLHQQSEYIAAESQRFKGHAVKVRRRLWWQNIRMNIVIALVLIILVAVIIGTNSYALIRLVAAVLPKTFKSKVQRGDKGSDDPNTVGNIENIAGRKQKE